jgi:hypothetical protein
VDAARTKYLIIFAALSVGFAVLGGLQAWLAPAQGWWNDEVYSLWASDPSAGDVIARVTGDSNPPLYFTLLRLMRTFFGDAHIAVPIASFTAIICSSAFVLWISRSVGWLTWGAIAIATFVINGVVTFYFQEARAFLLGACFTFAAAWQCTILVAETSAPRRIVALALLGALAAFTHFYAALAMGSLGGGLALLAILRRRGELLLPGLVLGGGAALSFGAWYAYAHARVAYIAWIAFNFESVHDALWYIRSLALGPAWMAAPLALIVGLAAWRSQALRPNLIVFAIASALFFALPVLISFKTPIIVGRYWTVGVPFLTITLVLIARTFWQAPNRWRTLAWASGALVLVSAGFGASAARYLMQIESVWSGAAIVAERGASCAPGSIRVPNQPELYATASGLPEATFVTPTQSSAPSDCPVLGWAEHVLRGDHFSTTASELELLQMVGVARPVDGVVIERHPSGFVILRSR